ncbi:MAG: twin-arginine translocation signal domain-containing protein [Planctomycetaceae bacterium]
MSSESSQPQNSSQATRRDFLKSSGLAAAAVASAPLFLHATNKSGSKLPTVGEREFTYECHHNWGELPETVVWGETHGVAIDEEGLIYIKHRNRSETVMDAIVVFDADGKCVRSFGKEYHTGGHGIDIRKDDGEEFLYLSDVTHNFFAKSTKTGEQIWRKDAPPEAKVYEDPNAKFSPTNIAFAPDGGFYVADGYGSNYIHQYDKDNNYVRTWGGTGDAAGQMKTPHSIWLDDRPGREPSLIVADRANARMQYFSLTGEHLYFVDTVSFPADIDIQGGIMMVPDLHARITLFDKDNNVITHLGYDPEWTKQVLADNLKLRQNPDLYQAGKFVHPHDAAFDKEGNIYVAEWVPKGRVTFLKKVG